MKRLVRELNERAIELDSKIESLKAESPCRISTLLATLEEMAKVERSMEELIEKGDAELRNYVVNSTTGDRLPFKQIKAVHWRIREERAE